MKVISTSYRTRANESPKKKVWYVQELMTWFNSYPFHSIPFQSNPIHSIPIHSIPIHSIPFHSNPFHSIPFKSILFQSIPFHPIHIPLQSIPFHFIPILSIPCFIQCPLQHYMVGNREKAGKSLIGSSHFRGVARRRQGSLVWVVSMRETLNLLHTNNKGTDQPAHTCSLIRAFVIRYLKGQMSLNSPFFWWASTW